MAKEYKVGERYYLPVAVFTTDARSIDPIGLKYVYTGNGNTGAMYLSDYPDLLLTAEEIALVINTERDEALAELKSRNAELEALLKEVMATRDEAIKQNNELIADRNNWKEAAQRYHDNAKVADKATEELRKENKDLKAKAAENADTISRLSANKVALTEEVGKLRETVADRTIDVQHLTEENDKLKTDLEQRNKDFWAMKKDRDELDSIGGKLRAENENLKAWYEEANKTATEAAEANDDLKTKIVDLRNRVGEQLAQIQDLNAEIHFHKEFGEGLDKQQKELQARYDELDSVNKEQAEKIRKLDKALTDLKKRNDDLQDENTNLNFLLEAQPEKGAARKVHVITNDGKEYMFRKCTKASFDNYNDFTVLKIYEGDTYVAGFLRGDSPDNFAAWWTE